MFYADSWAFKGTENSKEDGQKSFSSAFFLLKRENRSESCYPELEEFVLFVFLLLVVSDIRALFRVLHLFCFFRKVLLSYNTE